MTRRNESRLELSDKVQAKPTIILARWLEHAIPRHAQKHTFTEYVNWLRRQEEIPSYLAGKEKTTFREQGLKDLQGFLKVAFMREQGRPLAYDPNEIQNRSAYAKQGKSGNPSEYLR